MKDFLISVPAIVAGQVNPKERLVVIPEHLFRELVETANKVNKKPAKKKSGKKKR